MTRQGSFHIVNAGAGDADNITRRGWHVLQQAELVIASERRRERFAEALAGKAVMDGGHGLFTELARRWLSEEEAAQQEAAVRQKLVAAHAAGKRMVLLESGDTGLFSPYRGYLRAFAHFKPVLVPGVSSFNAANALLAQPILGDAVQRLQMSDLATLMQAKAPYPGTWVLFCMGLDLPRLVEKVQALYPSETQVAFIINAGYAEHEVIRCTVAEMGQHAGRDFWFPYCIIYLGL